MEATCSDARMVQNITKIMTRRPQTPERKGPSSLNAEARRKELLRVAKENRRLAFKLASPKPTVSTRELLEQHCRQREFGIRASHTARYSGAYDSDLARMKASAKRARSEAQQRFAHAMSAHNIGQSTSSAPGPPPPARPRSAGAVRRPVPHLSGRRPSEPYEAEDQQDWGAAERAESPIPMPDESDLRTAWDEEDEDALAGEEPDAPEDVAGISGAHREAAAQHLAQHPVPEQPGEPPPASASGAAPAAVEEAPEDEERWFGLPPYSPAVTRKLGTMPGG